MSRLGIIEKEPERRCELCNKEAETRPYGPNGERVCFTCGRLDEEAAIRAFSTKALGEHIALVGCPRWRKELKPSLPVPSETARR